MSHARTSTIIENVTVLLGALHPAGSLKNCVVIEAPERQLFPIPDAVADLVVIAPAPDQQVDHRWIRNACGLAASGLHPDGIIYSLVAPKHRHKLQKELEQSGFDIDTPVLHFPSLNTSRYLVPFSAPALRYSLTGLMNRKPAMRSILAAATRFPGALAAARSLVPYGFAARRRGARPLFAWVLGHTESHSRVIVVEKSWRPDDDRTVLHVLSDGGLNTIVRVAWSNSGTNRIRHERAALDQIAPSARESGVRVPAIVHFRDDENITALVETPVNGKRLACTLSRDYKRMRATAQQLTAFFTRWHGCTYVTDAAWPAIDATLDAAQRVSSDYAGRLHSLARGLVNPFSVAAHNDLTLWNIFADESGRLGIIDWEHAEEHGLPFVDFFYAVWDAAAAVNRYANRLQAFLDCYRPGGRHFEFVQSLRDGLARSINAPDDLVTFGFHACWLHHATNEGESQLGGEPGPFVRIVKEVASWPTL